MDYCLCIDCSYLLAYEKVCASRVKGLLAALELIDNIRWGDYQGYCDALDAVERRRQIDSRVHSVSNLPLWDEGEKNMSVRTIRRNRSGLSVLHRSLLLLWGRTHLATRLCAALPAILLCLFTAMSLSYADDPSAGHKIPVIFDTDIGDDIDDTWALAMLLRCPELDVKLVLGDHNKPQYRAKLIAKMLEVAGRSDIPVGIGFGSEITSYPNRLEDWIVDYDLARYPGTVHRDGVQAIIDTIMSSPEPVTLICVGPAPNIAAALKREPRIADNARFVGMYGNVRPGFQGHQEIVQEYNVVDNIDACRKALSAAWDIVITPLDTCGVVQLKGKKYTRVRDSDDPLAQAVIANYRLWSAHFKGTDGREDLSESRSSILFDTVAVYLAFSEALCEMEVLPITISDDGKTIVDPAGKKMRVATKWKDLDGFEDLLVERLLNGK